MSNRLCRSALYVPADNTRALDKARALTADAIIFDLEDAVAPDNKAGARVTLCDQLAQGNFGPRLRIVRINALDTPWGKADAEAVAGLASQRACDAVLLPKVNGPADIDALVALVPDFPIWAMMETPLGIINASAIARHSNILGLVLGTNDLAKDLGTRRAPRREPLLYALQTCVIAARAQGIVVLDGVYNAFKDDKGLAEECEQGRDMGFDGKTLIHPAQLELTNAAFAPTGAEIEMAERQIAAFQAAQKDGKGIAVVDGRIVENLHIVSAQATLAKAAAIAALEAK
jgi:(3S)-malyl-CoA thioesterase